VCVCVIGCIIGVFQSTGYKDQVMISGFAVFGLELGYRVFCVWGIVCVCVCECVCGVCVYTIGVVCVCVYHWGISGRGIAVIAIRSGSVCVCVLSG